MPKQIPSFICEPPCKMGVCIANGTSNLGSCKCDPFFTGETCDNYSCHTFCFNKGICYLDIGLNSENDSIAKVLLLFLLLLFLLIIVLLL